MEWVEVQGKTVDVAVQVAIGELGLESEDDVQIEVIQEAKPGFLGMGGREAIVKVTRAPKQRRRRRRGRGKRDEDSKTQQQANTSRNQRQGSKSGNGKQQGKQSNQRSGGSKPNQGQSNGKRRQETQMSETQSESQRKPRDDRPEQAPIEEQAEVATGFIRGLLEAFGLEGEVTSRIDDRVLYLEVTGEQTEALIGPKGSVMYSVLELTRTVVQRKTYGAPRMRIDIGGYVERRREALKIYAGKLASQVIEDEDEVMLESMNAADRKVVHDAVAEIDQVRSYSEGEDPRRAVVIAYTSGEQEN
jgi:spoIIIJ-associated protein